MSDDAGAFNLPRAIHTLEALFVSKALEEAKGKVSRAAELLGISHQTLCIMLQKRHKQLAGDRTPVIPRPRRTVIRRRGKKK